MRKIINLPVHAGQRYIMLGKGECPSGISKGRHEVALGSSQFFGRDLSNLSSLGKTARASTLVLLAGMIRSQVHASRALLFLISSVEHRIL